MANAHTDQLEVRDESRRRFLQHSLALCSGATVAAGFSATRADGAAPAAPAAGSTGAASPLPPVPLVPYGTGRPIYLADFSRCQPADALARTWQRRRWKLLDFKSEHVAGTMLTAGQNTAAPDVALRVGHAGWFAVYFGLLSKYGESRLEVRLAAEDTFTLLTHHDMVESRLERRDIELGNRLYTTRHFDELFWQCAEFQSADDTIVLRQLRVQVVPGDPLALGNRCLPCWLGYIKLVPLAPEEVEALRQDRARRDSRRLFTHNDSFGSTSWLRFSSAADIRREIEPYRDTDFSRMYWEAGMGDVTYYPSKVGRLFTLDWMKDHYRLRDRLVGETYADFQRQGVDPFRVALDHCHRVGLEFHAAYRVAGFYFPAPEDEWNQGGLYHRHPEWRGRDRAGRATPRLSYAFPAVRGFVLQLLRELAAYPLDGVCLLFNRRMPLVEYEAPLVEAFTAAHGVDPRMLPEDDPRWRAQLAAVLTGFMRDVRVALREEAARRKRERPIAVTAVVLSSPRENLHYGLDLATWVAEGLVDTLVPYSSIAGLDSAQPSWTDPREADDFVRLTKGTPCRLALNLMPRQIAPEDYRRRAHALYEAGVEYLFFWDGYQRNNYDRSWSALRRLGHREEIAQWVRQGGPPLARPQNKLTQVGDWDLSYGTPG